ncbi:MAG: fibronectin type III domain-containing protein [bacterium]
MLVGSVKKCVNPSCRFETDCVCALPSPSPSPVCNPGTPTTPTLTDPGDGDTVTGTRVTLRWDPPSSWGHLDQLDCTYSDYYQVYVGTSYPLTLQATKTGTTLNFPVSPGEKYYWRVRASNTLNSTLSDPSIFYTPETISGSVYLDNNNVCSTSNKWNLGGLSVRLRGTATTSVDGGGDYAIDALAGTYNYLDLLGLPADYICSTGCLQGCPTKTSVSVPSSNNNYYVTMKREAWWQGEGAGVYAGSTGGGTTIQSTLPKSTTKLILPGANGVAAILRASGVVDTGAGEISSGNLSAQTQYRGRRTNYEFFAAKMGVTLSQANDFASDTISKPANNPSKDFRYQKPGSGTVQLASAWNVLNGESYVVFIDGNLSINQNVTVAPGGFLIFIVSGSVTVSANVSSMQGLYVMNGSFVTQKVGSGDDSQLTIQGSIVTWTGVSLGRDLGVGNVGSPAEKFVYRADLVANMPDKMKGFLYNWQEVAPGTYGN